ncbi:hypothetical protein DK843_22505 (plasmid) [Chromobacterium phragmitis]|uniref:Uncharacterized protein n=1 Tax=Chromobacterium phragmitis TaxID=2202141 RepID=A0A344UPC7_9NEIS|nr:hypothetical protein DK843_22505 [Chromobacterium phragmitis]
MAAAGAVAPASSTTGYRARRRRSIYRFGLNLPDEDKYWFTFDRPVDVVPGPIADNTERTYITGLDVPRVTDFALAPATAASTRQLPVATYPLAVPTPIAPQRCLARAAAAISRRASTSAPW